MAKFTFGPFQRDGPCLDGCGPGIFIPDKYLKCAKIEVKDRPKLGGQRGELLMPRISKTLREKATKMSTQAVKEQTKYTYEDYLNFPENIRCEIINGEIYDMTPSPTSRHQTVSGQLYVRIWNYLKEQGHPCRVFDAPLDVILAQDQVVQPDIFIVCDPEKIKKYIFGAPDVIFEIASPSTTLKDRREKMAIYEKFGVTEYFLVDPEAELIEKYMLSNGRYGERIGIYAGDDIFRIDTIGFEITAREIFVI